MGTEKARFQHQNRLKWRDDPQKSLSDYDSNSDSLTSHHKYLNQGPIPPLPGSKQLSEGCIVVPLGIFGSTYAPHAPLLGPTTALGSPHTPPKPRPTSPKPRPASLPAAATPAPVPVHSPPGLSASANPPVRGRGGFRSRSRKPGCPRVARNVQS